MNSNTRLALGALLGAVAGCGKQEAAPPSAGVGGLSPTADTAAAAITADGLLQHIKDLVRRFDGRARARARPAKEKAVAYMQAQFKALGLKPGNPDGTYIQNVDLIGYKAHPTAIVHGGRQDDRARSIPTTSSPTRATSAPETKVENSDIVFVGYGVVAPEYGWDDYKGVDVKGKTILMLVNDPAGSRGGRHRARHRRCSRGAAMTYYGRWTYKYEIATEKGAAAAIIIHETGPAGYPYGVVQRQQLAGAVRRHLARRREARGRRRLDHARQGEGAARRRAGQNFDSLKAAAVTQGLQARRAQRARRTSTSRSTSRQIQSHNVVAKLEGTDKKDEYVVYTAHWDHLGTRHDAQGRPDLQRRRRQRVAAARRCSRSRRRSRSCQTPPRALDPVSVGDGGREGTRRREVLRDASALSARRRPSRTSTWTASTSGERRATSPSSASATRRSTTCSPACSRRTTAPCARTPSRRRASTTAPTISSLRKQGVPALDTDAGIELHREADTATACRSATSTRRRTITSRVGRSEAGLGSLGRASTTCACCSGSATSSRRRRAAAVEAGHRVQGEARFGARCAEVTPSRGVKARRSPPASRFSVRKRPDDRGDAP